MNQSDGKYI